jgi:dTMP kinase
MRQAHQPRGKYICLEGGDGCGKTTLAFAIFKALGDEQAVIKRFPSDGVVGSLIRQGLEGKVSLENLPFLYLFAADGLQEQLWIQDQLEYHGKHVICDRHPTLSGRVFQPEHHPSAHIEAVYNAAAADGISMPDTLFVIDVPVHLALSRMSARSKYRDVVFERHNEGYVSKIRTRYLELADRFHGHVLDGSLPVEELVDQVITKAGLR